VVVFVVVFLLLIGLSISDIQEKIRRKIE
jgi:hypothetical protein